MNNNSTNKKYKRPKQKTQLTTNPEPSRIVHKVTNERRGPEATWPLAAKDSEWVDIMQTSASDSPTPSYVSDEEEVLQLVGCENGPQMKPLAIMFPDLLEKDPNTLEGVLNKVMSTTEVTKHLVDLGQKANFTFMKKVDRLIPRDKQWLERLTENSNSVTSMISTLYNVSLSSYYDGEHRVTFNLGAENDITGNEERNEVGSEMLDPEKINTSYENIVTRMELSTENIKTSEQVPDKNTDSEGRC